MSNSGTANGLNRRVVYIRLESQISTFSLLPEEIIHVGNEYAVAHLSDEKIEELRQGSIHIRILFQQFSQYLEAIQGKAREEIVSLVERLAGHE